MSLIKRLARLAVGIALIVGFIGFLTNIERVTGKISAIEVLREKEIYVGAWYWDSIEEVSKAKDFMRSALGRGGDRRKLSEDREQMKD